MKKRTWRWVSRDTCAGLHEMIELWKGTVKPKLEGATFLSPKNSSIMACVQEFQRLFGFVPKPGECLRVEFSARVIKE